MTREEAIEMLNAKIECMARETSGLDIKCNNSKCASCDLCYRQGSFKEQMEYLDMAIEALKEPERVHAHWIEYERAHYFKCSRCKIPVPYKKAMLYNGARIYNYCPSCGAIMDEKKGE